MPVPDFSPGEILTASAMDSIGMWKIATQTFTGQTQVDFVNVFSSSYNTYRIEFDYWTATVGENHFLRLRDSGGVISSTNYITNRNEQSGATLSGVTPGGGFSSTFFPTFIVGTSFDANAQVAGYLDVFRPNEAAFTHIAGQFSRCDGSGGGWNVSTSGFFRLTTVCTGFSLIRNSTATMSGKVSVYGYRN